MCSTLLSKLRLFMLFTTPSFYSFTVTQHITVRCSSMAMYGTNDANPSYMDPTAKHHTHRSNISICHIQHRRFTVTQHTVPRAQLLMAMYGTICKPFTHRSNRKTSHASIQQMHIQQRMQVQLRGPRALQLQLVNLELCRRHVVCREVSRPAPRRYTQRAHESIQFQGTASTK